jgi:hypothetical protein
MEPRRGDRHGARSVLSAHRASDLFYYDPEAARCALASGYLLAAPSARRSEQTPSAGGWLANRRRRFTSQCAFGACFVRAPQARPEGSQGRARSALPLEPHRKRNGAPQGRQTRRAQRSVGPPGLRFVLLRSRGCELRSCLWLPSGRAFGALVHRKRLRRFGTSQTPSARGSSQTPSALWYIANAFGAWFIANAFGASFVAMRLRRVVGRRTPSARGSFVAKRLRRFVRSKRLRGVVR